MDISSRTPEGVPNRCGVCGKHLKIEPSWPAGDAPCPHCGHLLWFTQEEVGDAMMIKFLPNGELDAEDIERVIIRFPQKGSAPHLLLDFSGIESINSKVLGRLITLRKRMAAVSGSLKLCNVPPQIVELFRLTSLDKLFDIVET